MNTMRYESRSIRARRATARVNPRLLMLVGAMLAAFACFFAIGRATEPAPRTEAPASLPTAFSSVASPMRLSDAQPIEILAVRVRHQATPKSAPVVAPTPSVSVKATTPALTQTPLHSSPAPQPVSPRPEAAPAPVTHAAPKSTGGSKGGGGGGASPSSGGSFDNSG